MLMVTGAGALETRITATRQPAIIKPVNTRAVRRCGAWCLLVPRALMAASSCPDRLCKLGMPRDGEHEGSEWVLRRRAFLVPLKSTLRCMQLKASVNPFFSETISDCVCVLRGPSPSVADLCRGGKGRPRSPRGAHRRRPSSGRAACGFRPVLHQNGFSAVRVAALMSGCGDPQEGVSCPPD